MKSFKEQPQTQTAEKENQTTANAEELTKKIASAYHGKSNATMLKSILEEAEKMGKKSCPECR